MNSEVEPGRGKVQVSFVNSEHRYLEMVLPSEVWGAKVIYRYLNLAVWEHGKIWTWDRCLHRGLLPVLKCEDQVVGGSSCRWGVENPGMGRCRSVPWSSVLQLPLSILNKSREWSCGTRSG